MEAQLNNSIRRDADPERPFDVVVIGASAGGHTTIPKILGLLPQPFPLPIVIMEHLVRSTTSPNAGGAKRISLFSPK